MNGKVLKTTAVMVFDADAAVVVDDVAAVYSNVNEMVAVVAAAAVVVATVSWCHSRYCCS